MVHLSSRHLKYTQTPQTMSKSSTRKKKQNKKVFLLSITYLLLPDVYVTVLSAYKRIWQSEQMFGRSLISSSIIGLFHGGVRNIWWNISVNESTNIFGQKLIAWDDMWTWQNTNLSVYFCLFVLVNLPSQTKTRDETRDESSSVWNSMFPLSHDYRKRCIQEAVKDHVDALIALL